MKKRGKDINPAEKAKQEKERKTLLSDVEIHVMPESFAKKKTTTKEPPKPAPKPKPQPVPKPVSKPKPQPVSKKKTSKMPWIILGAGIVLIAVLAVGGYFMLRSLDTGVEIIDDIDGDGVIDKDDNCPQDANASQSDIDDDGTGDVCDSTDDRPEEVVEAGPGVDTDSDGLTDAEEDLYDTDYRDPDTDGDSFLDGNEVFHRYSPLGEAPQTLLDTGAVEIFEASDGSFSFTYPSDWEVLETVDFETNMIQEVVIQTNTTADIRIEVHLNSGDIGFEPYQETLTKEGYLMYLHNTELKAAVIVDPSWYFFTYQLNDESMIDFLQTFQMLINSFVVVGV